MAIEGAQEAAEAAVAAEGAVGEVEAAGKLAAFLGKAGKKSCQLLIEVKTTITTALLALLSAVAL